uniref:FHA domain-containing protein n=1 Tax=Glossina brevipalpis TaxID=37001 RepID=A0A1A9WLI0_9MUSC
MWVLKNTYTGNYFYFIAEKIEYTVGRLDADLELINDNSVSRAHAIFQLVIKDKKDFQLQLKDVCSKYGTFYNEGIEKNVRLNKDEYLPLKADDRIRFGRFENVWKVKHKVLNIVTSSLTKIEQTEAEEVLGYFGGKVLEEWSNSCTHLIMNEASVTIKLLQALLNQKPIMTINYWKDLLKAIRDKKTSLPNIEHYRPCFDETFDLNCKPSRQTLFRGYTFIFLHRKHADIYGPLVQSAGATYKNINAGVQKALLLKKNVIVIEYTPSTQTQSSQTILSIADFLKSNGRRIIPEYEIGYAILHCVTERYCNPCYISTSESNFLMTMENAPRTVTIDLTDDNGSDFVIPETNESLMAANSHKAKNAVEQESMPSMCITETPLQDNKGKRKHKDIGNNQDDTDDDDLLKFPKKVRNTLQGGSEANTEERKQQQKEKAAQDAPKKFLGKPKKPSQINKTNEVVTGKTRKRSLIQVLVEDDDNDVNSDDLFNFGDKSTQSKQSAKKHCRDDDEGLFSFKDRENFNASESFCEDSNDLIPTEEFVTVAKKTSKIIQLPKPKILPRKVSVSNWLSSSSNDLKYEQKEEDTNSATEECQNLVELLKDAFQIDKISANNLAKNHLHTHYKYISTTKFPCVRAENGTINFKKFVKKYQAPQLKTTSIHLI